MDFLGKLEKMKIFSFTDDTYTKPAVPPVFPVLVNPESYNRDYTIEYNTDAAQGNDGTTARYTRHSPEQFACELVFDNTGIIDGAPRPDVHTETEALKKFLIDLNSDTHEPNFFLIQWGSMIFKGRITSLAIQYKLFKPDGTPIRALAKATFKGSSDDLLRLALSNLLSPDLTHVRQVKAGDTLPNLCNEIYGSPRYCNEIARINDLTSYRRLTPGQELIFPPFDKKAST